ncbi:hypothetical protein Mapa_005382 [Marchantia paleacea]|nr:hypothetical protein Mapa_005382 [Marchantia paleacea]
MVRSGLKQSATMGAKNQETLYGLAIEREFGILISYGANVICILSSWNHSVRTYAGPINVILLHYSLAGGFSAPRITRTLTCTNYFTSPDHTYRRLFETLQFVIYCMKDTEALRCVTGVGWQSTIRVRLLHTQVRLRILSLAHSHPNYYSVEENGIPINQEDSMSTLCAFSICVIMGMERMGIRLTREEVNAYLHLWRLIGYYMGILPRNDPLISRENAMAAFESFVNHLVYPNEVSAAMTRSILAAVADKAPMRWSLDFHSAICRALLGDGLSDALNVEKSNWKNRLRVTALFTTFRWCLVCKPSWFLPHWIRLSRDYTSRMVQSRTASTSLPCDFTLKMVPCVTHN